MRFKKILSMIVALTLLCVCDCGALAMSTGYDMPYYIGVDVTNQIVTIYDAKDDTIVRQMLTSSGMNDCTPNGAFDMVEKVRAPERHEWLWLGEYRCFVKFATRIYRGYMFHSIPFDKKDLSTMQEEAVKDFGMPTSHGCMRLRVEDARFIAEQCQAGTLVNIYKGEEKQEELRQRLLISSYNRDSGISYNEFLGYSEDALGLGSGGSRVADLQYRLSDLGYYEGDLGGRYDTDTVAAVKMIQRDLGLAQTGITSPELYEVLFSENAPVAYGEVTLNDGNGGFVVERLQRALHAMGLYSGEMDSIYDLEVKEAVRAFQSAYGFTVDGTATPEIQEAVYHQLQELETLFGENEIPAPETTVEEVTMATMISDNNIIVRSKPDTDSENMGKLVKGDVVVLEASQDGWSRISVGAKSGFVMSKYLEPFSQNNVVLKWSNGAIETRLGHTMEEYKAGAEYAAKAFSAYYASEDFVSAAAEEVDFVTVNTGSDDLRLNLRAKAGADAEILCEIPNGTSLRVLGEENGYTKVGFDEEIGYLLSDYLTPWQGHVEDVQSTEMVKERYVDTLNPETDALRAFVVLAGEDELVEVYAEPSAESKQVGELDVGVTVNVLAFDEDRNWVRIRYRGEEGWMSEANLQFQLMATMDMLAYEE